MNIFDVDAELAAIREKAAISTISTISTCTEEKSEIGAENSSIRANNNHYEGKKEVSGSNSVISNQCTQQNKAGLAPISTACANPLKGQKKDSISTISTISTSTANIGESGAKMGAFTVLNKKYYYIYIYISINNNHIDGKVTKKGNKNDIERGGCANRANRGKISEKAVRLVDLNHPSSCGMVQCKTCVYWRGGCRNRQHGSASPDWWRRCGGYSGRVGMSGNSG